MPQRTDSLDLGRFRLVSGEGRRLDLEVAVEAFDFGGERYSVDGGTVDARLDVARMTGGGYSLRLRFVADLSGPCMRCLDPARLAVAVDAREIDKPGGGDELDSPYVDGEELDVRAWARDALALALPPSVLCREGCAGLCPECGENLNSAGPEHAHERPPDPRWAKLRELRLD